MDALTLSEAAKRWRPWLSARARQLDAARSGGRYRGYANWISLRQDQKAGALVVASQYAGADVEALALELQAAIAGAGPAIPIRLEAEGPGTVVSLGSWALARGQEVEQ